MFRCQLCQKVTQPGQTCERVVLERRPAEYPGRAKAQRRRIGRKIKNFDDPGGAGFEIAKEAMACPSCASTYVEQHVD